MGRTLKPLVALMAIAALFAADVQAQSRRSSRRSAGRHSGSRSVAIPPGFGFGTHPGFSGQPGAFVPIGAATGTARTMPPPQRSTPPEGFAASGGNIGPGFFGRIEQVHGGSYIPGYGVNNGFAAPEPVFGGLYTPGWGVNNGFARPEPVFGGSYIPGFGVTGGALNPAGGSLGPNSAVHGGNLVPGFGVMPGIR